VISFITCVGKTKQKSNENFFVAFKTYPDYVMSTTKNERVISKSAIVREIRR